jgi:hypothetical protein
MIARRQVFLHIGSHFTRGSSALILHWHTAMGFLPGVTHE